MVEDMSVNKCEALQDNWTLQFIMKHGIQIVLHGRWQQR